MWHGIREGLNFISALRAFMFTKLHMKHEKSIQPKLFKRKIRQ